MNRTKLSQQGFTLFEALVVVALIAIIAGLAFPALQRTVHQTRVMTELRKVTNLIQIARLESIRRGFPAVVQVLPATGEVVAFVDMHGPNATDPSDGLFNPIAGLAFRTTDYELQRIPIAAGLTFEAPDGDTGLDSVDGFNNPAPLPDLLAIYDVDGSVAAAGAFRFMDRRGNYLEARIAPAATGKVQIRKWDSSLALNWDGTNWYAEGEIERAWSWN